MKKIVLLTLFLCSFISLSKAGNATQPEKIEAISKVSYPLDYYIEQANLWKLETEKNSANPGAWLNYFRAARYANMLTRTEEKPFEMTAIVAATETAIPNSFEYYFIHYMSNDWSDERFGYLLKAHEIAPDRPEIYHDLITWHTVNGNEVEVRFFSRKLFEAGEFYPALLAWNYNLLASAEPDAILLTHGDNDTYPAWVLQSVKNIRTDVKVLNVNLLMYDTYRKKIFESLGIPSIENPDKEDDPDLYLAIVRQILTQAQQPVYLSVSIPEVTREAFAGNLFLTGLAFKYAPQSFDNVAVLKNNVENRFLKDYLKVDFNPDSVSSVMNSMNLNYLPSLLMLYQHYTAAGEKEKALDMEDLLRKIAAAGGRGEDIEAYLSKESAQSQPFESLISVKALDKQLKKVGNNLYAFDTEVTNAQYEAFLMDLVKNREFHQLEFCKTTKTDWRSLLPEEYKNLPDSEVFKNGHPDDPKAPVVNIPYEAAQRYCEWITKVYNASTDKKKAHRKVRFRLPTEAEWEGAARGGKEKIPYPWGGFYIRNSKGCFLANYDVSAEKPCDDCPEANKSDAKDGGFFPVMAASYFPNNFGLYNTSGNVAEMVQEAGITKGGSWSEIPYYGQITSRHTYNQPEPYIGFRVFMEVID